MEDVELKEATAIDEVQPAEPTKPAARTKKAVTPKVAEATKKSNLPHSVPTLLTGGDLSAWKVDLGRIHTLSVSKDDGATWTLIHTNDDAGQKAVRIPDVQFRAICFITLSFITNPCSDRGASYRIWVAQNKKLLEQELGNYQVKIMQYEKSLMPGILLPVKVATAIAPAQAVVLEASASKFKPKGRTVARKAQKAEEVDLVL